MKSVKPGRGPSMIGGVMGIVVALFGCVWTYMAVTMGAPVPFALFGVIFILIAIVMAVYNFRNATNKDRYSAYDITNDDEETDPLNERYGNTDTYQSTEGSSSYTFGTDSLYCPYCGAKSQSGFAYCNKCGKKLP